MKFKKSYIILLIPVIALIISAVFIISGMEQKTRMFTGIVEVNEIDISSKIPGRIDSIFVEEGSRVEKGQILAHLESKEIDAKVEQARGMMEAARNKMEMAHSGAREEEKRGAQKLFLQAKHQFDYVSKTRDRFEKLYRDSVISSQERDEIEFKYNAAMEQMEAAKAKYDMALNGARPEEIKAAEALFHQAENAFNEALAYKEELSIKAPSSGELYSKIADAGEIVAAGYPVFSVIDKSSAYVILQVKETELHQFEKGKTLTGLVPALDNKQMEFIIKYISPIADFATWKPTNQKGDFDVKTFEIRLYPISSAAELHPGSTVNFTLLQKVQF